MEKLDDYVKRLEKVVLRFESIQGGAVSSVTSASGQASTDDSGSTASKPVDSVSAFKQIVDVHVVAVVQAANTINAGGLILPEAYRNEAEITIVNAMSKCRKPQPAELQNLVAPLIEQLTDANSRTEGKRTDAFNHQKIIAEYLQALLWVGQTAEAGDANDDVPVLIDMTGKPSIFVDQCWQNAEFYGNKIMKEFRTQDPKHVKWVEAIKAVSLELKRYVTKYHLKEPTWKMDGISVSEFLGQEPPPETPPVVTPKKEVPQPTPLKSTAYWQPDQHKAVPQAAAFTDIKKGLKKVDQGGSKPAVSPKAAFQETKLKPAAAPVREPRMELEMDRKWNIEFFKGNKEIIVDQTSPKQTVYIFQCQDSVIQIKGKVNAITLDGCKKTGVVFEDVVSLVEMINCTRTDIQCTGHVATITIDKSDECKVFIPATCMDVGITTAKSSSINVTMTTDNADMDPVEHAIPYQFISRFKDGKLITEAVEHAGAA